MKLRALLRLAERHAYFACRRYRWPLTDDVKQEVAIKVWLAVCDNEHVSVPLVASNAVVDCIRRERGYNGNRPRICRLDRRDALKIPERRNDDFHHGIDDLDRIEAQLEGEERLLFRHMRRGHKIDMVARAMGMPRSTAGRKMKTLLDKARKLSNG